MQVGGDDPWEFPSRWWKILMSLELAVGLNWFNQEPVRKIGSGFKTILSKDI